MVKRLLLGFVFAFLLLGMASAGLVVSGAVSPSVSIIQPLDYHNYSSAIDHFNWTFSSGSATIHGCSYSFDDGATATLVDCDSLSSNFGVLADGDYYLSFYVNYSTGVSGPFNVPFASINFRVDTIAPVITLNGANPITLEVFDGYVEFGATASDNLDGDIGGVISIDNSSVNVSALGSYNIIYSVADNTGNIAMAMRVVNVVDTTAPVITLNGANPITLEVFDGYVEFGATASDNYDSDLTESIATTGSVDTGVLGSYNITYSVSDSSWNNASETRVVNVVDTTAPVIILNGANPVYIQAGDGYTEYGASASDNYNGDITEDIEVDSSSVDSSLIGNYSVSYYIEDSSGNNASATRTIVVFDDVSPVVTITNPPSDSAFDESEMIPNKAVDNGVPLTFWVSDVSSISQCTWIVNSEDEESWYGVNKDMNNTYYFNGEAGKYYWNVTCTDSAGNAGTSETRTFTILSDSDFGEGSDSTDLTNEANISSVMSFYVSTEYGMINWTGPLDLSSGFDWSQCIKISENNVSVDSVMCPELNSSATITVYNLNWTNPRVLRNGEVCSSPFCSEISYDSENGTFVFSVSGFSEYTTDETPVIVVSSSGGGGGGGDGSACYSNWTCSAWGACVDGLQTRICTLSKTNCFHSAKPVESQTCTVGGAEQPTGPTTETTKGEAGAGGVAGITGAVVGALGGGWTVALIFIAGIFGVAVFLRLREAKIAGEPVKITPDGYKKS